MSGHQTPGPLSLSAHLNPGEHLNVPSPQALQRKGLRALGLAGTSRYSSSTGGVHTEKKREMKFATWCRWRIRFQSSSLLLIKLLVILWVLKKSPHLKLLSQTHSGGHKVDAGRHDLPEHTGHSHLGLAVGNCSRHCLLHHFETAKCQKKKKKKKREQINSVDTKERN